MGENSAVRPPGASPSPYIDQRPQRAILAALAQPGQEVLPSLGFLEKEGTLEDRGDCSKEAA